MTRATMHTTGESSQSQAATQQHASRLIGLIGGMSWESTVPYYRIINEVVKEQLGGLHSARLVLYSLDFHDIEAMQRSAAWDSAGTVLADAARTLERAGAEALVLCTNTMHRVADAVQGAVRIPLLHIIDAVADAIRPTAATTIGLLGTRFTMEEPFYSDRLARHGLRVLTPDRDERDLVHGVIYDELCRGVIRAESRAEYRDVIRKLQDSGAEAIVLGCTEISLLVRPEDAALPMFDTTEIHARKAAEWALAADGGDRAAFHDRPAEVLR